MMRKKQVKCPKCREEKFALTINIYDEKQNELHLKCDGCGMITKMKIGDKK